MFDHFFQGGGKLYGDVPKLRVPFFDYLRVDLNPGVSLLGGESSQL